ncbi:MAG TPA: GDSL-type esterase/lipase family protein [Acidimicrobiales bacterium]
MTARHRWAAALAAALLGTVPACGDDGGSSEDAAGDPAASPFDLVVLGDSFVEHSRDQIRAYAESQGLAVEVMGLGGTAICNWDDKLEAYAAAPPRIMVISFAGNDIPHTCFNPTDESRDAATVAAGYREELDDVVELFADTGAELWAVVPPPIRDEEFEERAAAMRVMYAEAAADHPDLRLVDAADGLGTEYRATLPCEPWDDCPPEGEVVVRDDDGIHLAPAGAERYARTIVDTVT